jgi:hypothetical protein
MVIDSLSPCGYVIYGYINTLCQLGYDVAKQLIGKELPNITSILIIKQQRY